MGQETDAHIKAMAALEREKLLHELEMRKWRLQQEEQQSAKVAEIKRGAVSSRWHTITSDAVKYRKFVRTKPLIEEANEICEHFKKVVVCFVTFCIIGVIL